jgi:hypothetical protein
MRQTCILFDLDNTLVHATLKENNTYDIMTRPHVHKLLNFLYKNQNKYCIGFWSSGVDTYVKFIINTLLEPYPDWSVVLKLARYHKLLNNNHKLIDLDTYKIYDYPDNKIVKHIRFLREHEDFNFRLRQKKIILIDDLDYNIHANERRHTYKIKAWTNDMTDDKEILLLYRKLKRKNITNKYKTSQVRSRKLTDK